ncbi:hypothetical protein CAPN001_21060 [Capnocytophaga stomatis]|uniref:hypothetical protein n=1 Tax=Capnocytophaga stomatis TaxID=1848904 RepID=UPI0019518A01|nr:hypothetical protein [Capnocytophaga stomatis]GIJ97537.1 hypothetical protein CAPN001_21060 [Capnocytophaga stomatis]
MENRVYNKLKEWFDKRDFSFDTYIEFEEQKNYISLLKIKKIEYDLETNGYVKRVYPIKLFLYEITLNGEKIDCFLKRDWIKSILITNDKKPNLEINFYYNSDILRIIAADFEFLPPYKSPYIPPFRINKEQICVKILKEKFSIEYIIKEFYKRGVKVSLNGYFGEEIVTLPKNGDYVDLLGINICCINGSQNEFGINICNLKEENIYLYITFELQNSNMISFWHTFLDIIISYNFVLEVKSGNITYSNHQLHLLRKDFEMLQDI